MAPKKFRLLSLFALCFIQATAMAQRYTVKDLGPFSPTGVNSWAQVVGNYNGRAFIWARGHAMRNLGLLPNGTFSSAAAINDLGVVTGTADGVGIEITPDSSTSQKCSDLTQPFVWTQRTGMQGLGATKPWNWPFMCNIRYYAADINVRGRLAGYTSVFDANYQYGFLRSASEMSALMGPEGGNWPPTFANAISTTDQIVGQSSSVSLEGIGHATSWKDGIAVDLGTWSNGPDSLDYGSAANDVNDLGTIVGWASTMPVLWSSPVHAVIWKQTGEIQDLGTLGSDPSSAASRVNLFGQVIGSSGDTLYSYDFLSQRAPFVVTGRPFIWSQRTGMRDLNALIPQNSGWVLQSATDINIWGQIVGQGTHNGHPRGYLLTPFNPFKVF